MWFKVKCWQFIIPLLNYFVLFTFLLQLHVKFSHWAFIFRVLVCLFHSVVPVQVPCTLSIYLYRNYRWLSWYCVEWPSFYLVAFFPQDISIVKVYLCNQGDTVSLLSRLFCHILNLPSNHGNNSHSSLHTNSFQVRCWLSFMREIGFCMAFYSCSISTSGSIMGGFLASSYTNCQHYYTLKTPFPTEILRLNVLNHSWQLEVNYMFPSHAVVLIVLFSFLAEHVTGQYRLLILIVPCWMEVLWLPLYVLCWKTFISHLW